MAGIRIKAAKIWKIGATKDYEGSYVVTIPKQYVQNGLIDAEIPIDVTVKQTSLGDSHE